MFVGRPKMAVGVVGCVALAGLVAAACGAPEPPGEEAAEGVSPEGTAESAQAVEIDEACPGTVWIGRGPAAQCPLPASSSWAVSKLFPGAAAAPLDSFCMYEWVGAGPPHVPSLPKLPGHTEPATVWLDKDCHVVAPLGDTEVMRAAVAPGQLDVFLRALRAPRTLSLPPSAPTVRVAVIDSWPSPYDVGRAAHGFGMAALVRTAACDGVVGPCPIDLRPYLALDLTAAGTRDPVHGGHFGYQGAVAKKIFEATRDWQEDETDSPLVLNLSIGWDAAYNVDEEGGMSEAAAAVREALAAARCAGALAFAAAGNESGGPTPSTGVMFPAAWEQVPVSCPAASGQPHVVAVGAVDAVGGPLPTARPGAEPRLVADGYLVPAQGPVGGVMTTVGPYSGTSVSCAAATGAAALVWSMNSGWTAGQVANHLYQTATPTPAVPDFCPSSGACLQVRRLSLCAATGSGLASCRFSPIKNPTWGVGEQADLAARVWDSFDPWTGTATLLGTSCDGDVFHDSAACAPDEDEACPVEQRDNETVVPWLTPQPGNPICGACLLAISDPAESILELGISERLLGTVYPGTLSLLDDTGLVVQRYDLTSQTPVDGLYPGKVYEYPLPGLDTTIFKHAVVEWLRGPDGQAQSDIPLAETAP